MVKSVGPFWGVEQKTPTPPNTTKKNQNTSLPRNLQTGWPGSKLREKRGASKELANQHKQRRSGKIHIWTNWKGWGEYRRRFYIDIPSLMGDEDENADARDRTGGRSKNAREGKYRAS